MEPDKYVPGNILYAARHQLKTTDGKSTSLVIGKIVYGQYYKEGREEEAVFDVIAGFAQLNSSTVLVSDREHHCLRVVNRVTRDTKPYMGTCKTSGFRDGEQPLFSYPWGIVLDDRGSPKIYVADKGNHAIRMIDMTNGSCLTIASHGLNEPLSMTLDWFGHSLVVANGGGDFVGSLDIQTLAQHVVVGIPGQAGYRDGNISTSLFDSPKASVFISESLLLVADELNHVIRVVDLTNDEVYSICSGVEGNRDGYVCDCQVNNPLSLLYHNGYLYIGQEYGISRMRGTCNALASTSTSF